MKASARLSDPICGAGRRWRSGFRFWGCWCTSAFRFKPIYGVAAIVALLHDVVITLGLFALTQKEISLTVIAALLTLVGYSVNDTIVIFDRVRENLRLMRKESIYKILNLSINQTLSRTIMTSGFTFLAVFSLFLFGGEVLNGFSFALTDRDHHRHPIPRSRLLRRSWNGGTATTEQKSKAEAARLACAAVECGQTAKMFENHGNAGEKCLDSFSEAILRSGLKIDAAASSTHF